MSKLTKKYSFKLKTNEKRPESVLRTRTGLKAGLMDSGGWCAPICIDHKRPCQYADEVSISYEPC